MLKIRYVVVVLLIGIFILSINLSQDTIKNFQLMPSMASNIVRIDLETESGTSLEQMSKYTTEIEKKARSLLPKNPYESVKSTIGRHESKFFSNKGNYEHWSTITISLVPVNERDFAARDIVMKLRKNINMKKYSHFTSLKIMEAKHGPPPGEAIDVKIISDDLNVSKEISDSLKKFLEKSRWNL